MLKTFAAAAAFSLALAGAAHAQNMAATHEFLSKASASDAYERAAGKIAETRGKTADIKAFGAMMVRDHTKSSALLSAAGEKSMGHPVHASPPSAEQDKMLAELRSAPAANFDRVYLQQQKKAHEEALALIKGYADHGDYPGLKAAAAEIVPTVQAHLTKADALLAAMK
jgi:putative membrane protein